ncbi:hypothetical protein [Tropicibacter sp. S64]|uniref:hypothetical protein n=1 Tax=Tropicibacter sp. S64 TaxID=3415122 RepID=UPI003C7B097B
MTLRAGDTATCTTLNDGQLYAVFIYNSAQNATNADIFVNWSNSQPPQKITVPGTTANAGLASLGFVSGSDTQTVSVSMPTNSPMGQVEIWLGSVSMPVNTAGLDNEQLPSDGAPHPFDKYRRYYAVPTAAWHQLTIKSSVTQFISVQFQNAKAKVFVVNESSNGLLEGQVVSMGPTAQSKGVVEPVTSAIQSIMTQFQGNGQQYVWMNADSADNSDDATIAMQSI